MEINLAPHLRTQKLKNPYEEKYEALEIAKALAASNDPYIQQYIKERMNKDNS